MDEDRMLERITRLLEQGGTMLATHHSCGAPLFRYKGQEVCPVCSFEERSAAKDTSNESDDRSSSPDQCQEAIGDAVDSIEDSIGKAKPSKDVRAQEGRSVEEVELRRIVLRKLEELAEGIIEEKDLDMLRKRFDCVEAALRTLRSMER